MATKMRLTLVASHPANPKDGDLCVWNFHDPPHTLDRYAVSGLDEAKSLIRRLTAEQLKDEAVGCNAFGLEVYREQRHDAANFQTVPDGWEEWEHPETGEDIVTVMDAEDEEGGGK